MKIILWNGIANHVVTPFEVRLSKQAKQRASYPPARLATNFSGEIEASKRHTSLQLRCWVVKHLERVGPFACLCRIFVRVLLLGRKSATINHRSVSHQMRPSVVLTLNSISVSE